MAPKQKIGPRIFELIAKIDSAKSVEEGWAAYMGSARSVGFRFGFAKVSNRNTPLAVRLIANSMPGDWLKNYTLRSYEKYDGVAIRVRGASTAFEWCIDEWAKSPLPKQQQWREEMRALGIERGFSVPFVSRGEFKSVTVCGKGGPLHPHDRMTIHFAGLEFLARVRELTPNKKLDNHPLSARESECLQWAALGKSDGDIGSILSLSEKTVNGYIERAKYKLGASTRVQAVVTALRDGLIQP